MKLSRTSVVVSVTGLMVVAAVPTFFLAVFASRLMSQFDVGHAQVGLLISLMYGAAAAFARPAGDLVDRFGATSAGKLLLACQGVTMAIFAWSPGYLVLLPTSLLAGMALALCNPVTNVVIRHQLSGRLQRSAMGIKQGGVPLAIVLAGGVFPGLGAWIGWRGVAAVVAVFTLLWLLGWTFRPGTRTAHRAAPAPSQPGGLPNSVALSLLRRYALIMGGLAGLMNTFFVVFIVKQLRWPEVAAGWVIVVVGASGAISRWLWLEIAGRASGMSSVMAAMTAIGLLGTAAMWYTRTGPDYLVWVSAVFLGMSVMGWQGYIMHAVASRSAPSAIGQESGRIMRQFYIGLLLTPLTIGWAIEYWDSYTPLLVGYVALLAAAFVPVLVLFRLETSPPIRR